MRDASPTKEAEAALVSLQGAPPRTWAVTGAAGFIGSHLVEALLAAGQRVVGLDNFSTGHRSNLEAVSSEAGDRFRLVEGDVRDPEACREAVGSADVVLHQAALGSVPRSLADPAATDAVNVHGFVNVAWAAKEAGVRRMVYASSSSVYGDHPGLPKVEGEVGRPLSPYAVSKRANELYAATFSEHYPMEVVGLRYFNVFGPRQDPGGPYAAVIPKWFDALADGRPCTINGDGKTSRDFCYVANVVQANLRAATSEEASGVYNVAYGERTTLNELYHAIRDLVGQRRPEVGGLAPRYVDFRAGDVRHSLADVHRARRDLGYVPSHSVSEGLAEAAAWYLHPERLPDV